jgi:antirestriction protein
MKEKMAVYVADLGMYNESKLVGKWFELPLNISVNEALRQAMHYDPDERDYAIHDWENIPFEIGEYSSLYEVNRMAEAIVDFDDVQLEVLKTILEDGIADFDRAVEMVQDGEYRIYHNCEDMSDVAYQVLEESGYLCDLPEIIKRHIDYESLGEELETSGTWRGVPKADGSFYIEIIG